MSRSKVLGYGIDFGTTNSSIGVAYRDGAEVIPVEAGGSTVLPSIVAIDAVGNELAGNDAVDQFVRGGWETTQLMSSLKSFLADESFTKTQPFDEEYRLEELVSILLRRLKAAADHQVGEDVRRVVIGHPVLFVGAEGERFESKQEKAISRLEKAAQLAGFEEIAFQDEPTAALTGETFQEGIVMAVDFGGGTFDVSVIELTPGRGEVLAIHGAAIGGELFDASLFDAKVCDLLGLNGTYQNPTTGQFMPVPALLRKMRTLAGILSLMKDPKTERALHYVLYDLRGTEQLRVVENILQGGHAYNFYRAIEKAKIDLSEFSESGILFRRPDVNVHAKVTRAEFETMIRPNLVLIDAQIDRALADAGIEPDDVDLVVRTGGSSRVAGFVDRLAARFGPDKLAERDAFSTVALGLSMEAYNLWSNC